MKVREGKNRGLRLPTTLFQAPLFGVTGTCLPFAKSSPSPLLRESRGPCRFPSAFAHLHLCPSHLAGPLQNPLRSTPPYGRSLGLHFTSPPQSELGPLSCWLNWSSPQPSGPCLPEEEHLESFIWSSDELRGGGACLSPPSAHAPCPAILTSAQTSH